MSEVATANKKGNSNTHPFQSSARLQTRRPPPRSAINVVVSNDAGAANTSSGNHNHYYDASEARYWAEKFGLGGPLPHSSRRSRAKKKHAHPRAVQLNCGTAAAVHQIVLGVTATGGGGGGGLRQNAKHHLLAVACGPRVPLYGTTPQSELHRALMGGAYDARRTVDSADRAVPTGGQLALAASLRSDGRLLAIGTASGVVRVADTTSRATLCQLGGAAGGGSSSSTTATNSSNLPIRTVAWFRDGQHILAAGDDGVLRVWALHKGAAAGGGATTAPVLQLKGHGDAIRCADLWQKAGAEEESLAATGSYDHTVRLWNVERLTENNNSNNEENNDNNRCRFVLLHGAPVEALQWIKASPLDKQSVDAQRQEQQKQHPKMWLVSAGGTQLKVWNPVTGHCVCTLQAQHRKSITCLLQLPRVRTEQHSGGPEKTVEMRLVTGGLDGLLRIHAWDKATGQLRYLHGIAVLNNSSNTSSATTTTAGITALAATFAGDRIAIGTTEGRVLVRQMGPSVHQRKRQRQPSAGTYSFFTRGMNADPVPGDHVVSDDATVAKKRKLPKFDVALRQFRYGDALDEALQSRMPQAVVAVLEELGRRRGLTIALSNRDEESLEPVLAFTARYIARPRFAALLVGVAHKLIDIYGHVAGQSETIDELFVKLKNQVSTEVRTQKLLFQLVGQLDSVLTEVERLER